MCVWGARSGRESSTRLSILDAGYVLLYHESGPCFDIYAHSILGNWQRVLLAKVAGKGINPSSYSFGRGGQSLMLCYPF